MSINLIRKSYHAFSNTPANVLHDVSLNVAAVEAIGLIEESGSGKSMIAKCMLALIKSKEDTIT